MVENWLFLFLLLFLTDFFLLKINLKSCSVKTLLKFTFCSNFKFIFLSILIYPFFLIWFLICYGGLTVDLNDGGIILLAATSTKQILYWTILRFPELCLLCFVNYKLKKEYFSKLKEIKITKNLLYKVNKIFLYSFILTSLLFLVSIYSRILFVPARSCSEENSLLAIPYHDQWNRDTPNIRNALNKQGVCFNCDYWQKALVTTKEECNKCPNREYTDKTCVLKECPDAFPIKVKNSSFSRYPKRGRSCGRCPGGDLIETPEECNKCPNANLFISPIDKSYSCIEAETYWGKKKVEKKK